MAELSYKSLPCHPWLDVFLMSEVASCDYNVKMDSCELLYSAALLSEIPSYSYPPPLALALCHLPLIQ